MIPAFDGGNIPAYVALPDVWPAPAVVMVPAVFGPNADACAWADRYAKHGFMCIVPDFFWRTIPGPLRPSVPEELALALERTKRFDIEAGMRDLEAVRDYALARLECNGKWAVAGYCFGGRYTLRAAAYLDADAAVAFHPTRVAGDVELAAAASIACPLSFHFGGADDKSPPEDIAALEAALVKNPAAECLVYPGVDHGFTMVGEHGYDAPAAERSFARALDVLAAIKNIAAV